MEKRRRWTTPTGQSRPRSSTASASSNQSTAAAACPRSRARNATMYGGQLTLTLNIHRALPRRTVAPPTSPAVDKALEIVIRSPMDPVIRAMYIDDTGCWARSVPPQKSSASAASCSTPSWAWRYSAPSISLSVPAEATDGSTRCRTQSTGKSSAIPMTFASARPFPSAATESIPQGVRHAD